MGWWERMGGLAIALIAGIAAGVAAGVAAGYMSTKTLQRGLAPGFVPTAKPIPRTLLNPGEKKVLYAHPRIATNMHIYVHGDGDPHVIVRYIEDSNVKYEIRGDEMGTGYIMFARSFTLVAENTGGKPGYSPTITIVG